MTNFEFHLENFMIYCSSKNLSRKTLSSYEQTLKLFAAYLQNDFSISEVDKIQAGHLRQYIKYLNERGKYTVVTREDSKVINRPQNRKDYNKEISTTIIANYVRNIKVFFNYLYQVEKEIPKNPAASVENPKIQRKMKKTLTSKQLKKVFGQFNTSTFHGYRNRVITRLLIDTGMRIGECLSILPEHIDFHHKSIHIMNAKNKQERFVCFSYKSANELKQWLRYRDRYSDSPFLFPTIRGTQLEIRNYERALREAGERVEVSVHPHQLRNNFAKYYILNGGDWFSLCRILGHSSVEVTQKAYLDFSDNEIVRRYQKHSPLTFLDDY